MLETADRDGTEFNNSNNTVKPNLRIIARVSTLKMNPTIRPPKAQYGMEMMQAKHMVIYSHQSQAKNLTYI
ncbi:hypothetical protein L1987_17000 [Smallanthus sonchifolius]|uniref:Uncharacterized protein n=1 Tax=Smallanthus sonchifolius TaxID=185202 RepID=A0ACB9IX78_9ASTR|nr:hypothetical protein L1987_17000 [Smallanthus sonchifolius]